MLTFAAVHEYVRADSKDSAVLTAYINAAISAAEHYTGRKMKPGTVVDRVENPAGNGFRLSAKPTGPVVAKLFLSTGSVVQYPVTVSGGKAYLPSMATCYAMVLEFHYKVGPAGTDNKDVLVDTDPMIELGILKFVAHATMNKGDEPSSWACDSGAQSLWKSFRPIGF